MAKRPTKSGSSKSGSKSKRKPQSFFQKLSKFFERIFTAPSIEKAEKTRAHAIRQIKARGYSPSYEKRLVRAVERGNAPSLQQARGHKPGEARQRAAREREEQGGLTNREINAIKSFHAQFDKNGTKQAASADQMIEYAQFYGYKRFTEYRDAWRAIRKQYEREIRKGTWASRGEGAFEGVEDFLSELYDLGYDDAPEWFYYH